ncbi:MAG: nucleotidyltransferase domain-containing protein [Lachnospiraceae bacterium]|nr:nucleotidyltransferase domain-containing protein [Lachnospiraceae bacterium]
MCSRNELKTVLGRVKEESIQIYGNKLDKIILYGSYARGDNTDESDIDIMILLDCDKEEVENLREKTYEMANDISLDEDVFLSILLRDKKNFEENQDFLPFYRNVVREGIAVYG